LDSRDVRLCFRSPRLRHLPYVPVCLYVASYVGRILLFVFIFSPDSIEKSTQEYFRRHFQDIVVSCVAGLVGIALTLFQVTGARRTMRMTVAAQWEWPVIGGMVIIALPVGIVIALVLASLSGLESLNGDIEAEVNSPYLVLAFLTGIISITCFVSTALWGL